MQLGIAQRIQDIFALDAEKGVLEFEQSWYSWGQLKQCMESIEKLLIQTGLPAGTPVGIVLRNRPAHVAAIVQILISKRCIIPINPFQSSDKICTDLTNLQVPIIIADSEDWQKQKLRDCSEKLGAVAIEISAGSDISTQLMGKRITPDKGPYHKPLEDTAVLMLTSGTTGPAKRIKLSYSSFEQSVLGAVKHYEKEGAELRLKSAISLLCGPLVHIGGLYFVFDCMVSGRSFCLLEKFSVNEWVRAVKNYQIKMAAIPPSAIRMIYDADTPKEDLASLIAIRSGSAPLPLDLQDEFETRYGIPILDVYGATEFSGAIAGWTLKDHQQFAQAKRGSVGRAQPGVEINIVDSNTNKKLDTNTVGILEVRSKQAGQSGWVRTTDLAEMDDDGFLYIRGRADNAIIRGGFKILPREVEDIILQHKAVKTAAVFGIDDRRLGAIPVAAIELNENMKTSEAELIAFVKDRTVAYKAPAQISIMDELPRTPSMKVSIHALRAIFDAKQAANQHQQLLEHT